MAVQITVSGGYVDVSVEAAEIVLNFLSISVTVDIDSAADILAADILAPGNLFIPSGSDYLITSDGKTFRVQ